MPGQVVEASALTSVHVEDQAFRLGNAEVGGRSTVVLVVRSAAYRLVDLIPSDVVLPADLHDL